MEVERRSIEFIPEGERYGSCARLFSIWFSSNMQVTALIIGALGVMAGLNLFWGVTAVVLGTAIGAVFMAGHSAQGPHLGIPQMIQSRAQFGVFGAAVPLGVIVISYVLFTAANAVVMRSSIQAAVPLPDDWAIVVFTLVTLAIAYIGYELIHRLGVWMSIASGLLFLVVAVIAFHRGFHPGAWTPGAAGFKFQAFVLGATQAASWSIGFGPYVADYSRYLPKSVRTSSTFWYSYAGQTLGASLVMALGAVLASFIPHLTDDPGGGVARLAPSGRWLAYIVVVLGVLEVNVLNIYSAYMSVATMFTGFAGIRRITRGVKFAVMAAIAVVAAVIAIATQHRFQTYFADILIAQIYFIVPWTSINLTDFYLVRFGRYDVADIYDKDGRYGQFNWTSLAICAVTVLAEIPFMGLSFYTGPIARWFGTDVTVVVGLILPAALYYIANRRLVDRSRGCALEL